MCRGFGKPEPLMRKKIMRIKPAIDCRMPVICKGGINFTVSFEINQVVPQKNDIAASAQYPPYRVPSFKCLAKKTSLNQFDASEIINSC